MQAERLSQASSFRSSLPSIMGDGEEGGGEDVWIPRTTSPAEDHEDDGRPNDGIYWKKRYEELRTSLDKFLNQLPDVRDVLKKKLLYMEKKMVETERRAEAAEREAQLMEKRLLAATNANICATECHISSNIEEGEKCSHKDCLIFTLEQQIQEQKRLRLCDAKRVEENVIKIREWITAKLRELEDQNQQLQEKLNFLKINLEHLSQYNPDLYEKQTEKKDSSHNSFEDHLHSKYSLPSPKFLEHQSPLDQMQSAHREITPDEPNSIYLQSSTIMSHEESHTLPCSTYTFVGPSAKIQPDNDYEITAPPKVKIERKKYIQNGCFNSSLSSASEVDYSSWYRESSSNDSESIDGILNSPRVLDSPVPAYSEPTIDISEHASITSETAAGCQEPFSITLGHQVSCQDCNSVSKSSCVSSCNHLPVKSAISAISDEEGSQHFHSISNSHIPGKNVYALEETEASLKMYKQDDDEMHDYAEIYTPIKESSDFCGGLNQAEMESLDERLAIKPPTPPLHRFPSWESRIYEVAKAGINACFESIAAPDSSNNNLNITFCESHCTNAAYNELHIPVYSSIKGRASQIRSVPFTSDSSDSSDNEDCRASSHTTSGDTESSTSLSALIGGNSPTDKKAYLNTKEFTLSSLQDTAAMPKYHKSSAKRVCKELSTESVLTNDYAIPPDAISLDNNSSTNTMDNHSTLSDNLRTVKTPPSSDKTPKKKSLEKSGYLTKLGGKFKTWKRRWFVLQNGTLSYYKSQSDVNRKPQGQIILDHVCHVNRAEGASTFEITTGKKTYYLTADSISLMEEWIKVLQNVLKCNAAHLILSKEDKPTLEGWLTKVKHGHSRRCWCMLIGKIFMYFKSPNDFTPLGQISMRDARVEEVSHVSDSDDDQDESYLTKSEYTIGIFPNHQGPTYLLMDNKQEMDSWLYHLTVVSSGDNLVGTHYEQLVAKLMEVDGDENNLIWRHPLLLYSKENITQPITRLPSEQLQTEGVKLFKSLQLFISVPLNTSGIDYHIALAQNALHQCLIYPELQNEFFCQLIKQTSRHSHQKTGMQQFLISATQSLFLCDASSSEKTLPMSAGNTEKSIPADSKLNPPPFVFIQGWQLLSLAISLFIPKNRTLWYLRNHLKRNSDAKFEAGKYAIFCQRSLERAIANDNREYKPSRMEVLSILSKNPYHHSLPHSIPVHFANGAYQVFGFDGSMTIKEFIKAMTAEIGVRNPEYSGFSLFSDDPVELDLEHCLQKEAKLCDVISQWEQALREKHLGKFENTKVLKLTYKNRLSLRENVKMETDKEKLLIGYQINDEIVNGRFPVTKEMAFELAALLAQIEFGDYIVDSSRNDDRTKSHVVILQAIERFFPKKFRDSTTDKKTQLILKEKWLCLKGQNAYDCVRIYLNCVRKWPYCGGKLFQTKLKCHDEQNVWLAITENGITILDSVFMHCLLYYPYSTVMTFGGCHDDFMLVVSCKGFLGKEQDSTECLLFAMAKPKILELTLLVADYMNAGSEDEPYNKRATGCISQLSPDSASSVCHSEKFHCKLRINNSFSQDSNITVGNIPHV